MATLNQSSNNHNMYPNSGPKYSLPSNSRTPILNRCPQVNGIVTRIATMSPNKPNSAIRHVANVDLSNGLRLTSSLPGKGYLCAKYNRLLISGGSANDLPGVGYSAVRGVYDFSPIVGNNNSRSSYGVSSPAGYTNFVRSSLSN